MISVSEGVPSKTYAFTVKKDGSSAEIIGKTPITNDSAITATETASIAINGEEVKIEEGDTMDAVLGKIRELCNRCNITFDTTNDTLSFKTQGTGVSQTINLCCNNIALATKLGIDKVTATTVNPTTKDVYVQDNVDIGKPPVATGTDAWVEPMIGNNGNFTVTTTVVTDGNMVKITDQDGFEMKFEIVAAMADDTPVNLSVLDSGPLTFQIGANEGQTLDVAVPEVSVRTLGIGLVNVKTQQLAENAITTFSEAINLVSGIRAKLGAYQNRLEHTVVNLDTTTLNVTESLSRVEDVDMAEEMANYTQKNILSQAGVSMLSQANERPQQILSLLQ